jgi:hypothetical protein
MSFIRIIGRTANKIGGLKYNVRTYANKKFFGTRKLSFLPRGDGLSKNEYLIISTNLTTISVSIVVYNNNKRRL